MVRLLIFKVGESGRSKPHERRVEITSTYVGGSLERLAGVTDVLLGYDEHGIFVGFDTRRLEHGGETQNASAFIDAEGLRLASSHAVTTLPRDSGLFGTEYHAFFRPARLAEYLANQTMIHGGSYRGGGMFAGSFAGPRSPSPRVGSANATGDVLRLRAPSSAGTRRAVSARAVEAIETGRDETLRTRHITPEQYADVRRVAEENGALGEQFVLEDERDRLRRLKRPGLAARVEWTSLENVAAGYDISSFEANGQPRYIEVKATAGASRRFVMTRNEWRTATALAARYWIYLVNNVTTQPSVTRYQDPVAMETAGALTRDPLDWTITIQ